MVLSNLPKTTFILEGNFLFLELSWMKMYIPAKIAQSNLHSLLVDIIVEVVDRYFVTFVVDLGRLFPEMDTEM